MQGPVLSDMAPVLPTVRPTAPVLRALSGSLSLSREESRRQLRERLLRFIKKNHNRGQLDSHRGLRITGAD